MLQKRPWTWIDWSMFGVFTSWIWLGLITFLVWPPVSGFRVSVVLVVAYIVLCYFLPLAVWRPGYVHTGWVPVVVLLTIGGVQLYLTWQTGQLFNLLLFPLVVVAYLSNRQTLWWTAPAFLLGVPLAGNWLLGDSAKVGNVVQLILASCVFFGIGLAIQRLHQSHQKTRRLFEENLRQYELIRQQNGVLEQYARQVENLTVAEERNRLARELHDTVGHTFTSVIMGMDAVAILLESAPDKAKAKLEVLRSVTRRGLEEVRQSIHQIAPEDEKLPLSRQVARLAGEFEVHTGTHVKLDQFGVEEELSGQVKLTFIRCLQESLTNAKRHGQADNVRIQLEFLPSLVRLLVEDDGSGSDELQSGFGLSSMKERLAALGGQLHVQSGEGSGTTVVCTVPLLGSMMEAAAVPTKGERML